MPPKVEFTEESAGAVECATWLGSQIVDGSLVEEIFADVPGAVMVISRLSHSIALAVAGGPTVFGAASGMVSDEFVALGEKLGVKAEVEEGKAAAIGDGAFLKALLIALAKIVAEQLVI